MTVKDQLTFSRHYTKLDNRAFKTVRWPDSVYFLGKTYHVVVVEKVGLFYRHKSLGWARIVRMDLAKLGELATEEFCLEDAGCLREEYFKLMMGWYRRKPDWRGWDSEVQVLSLVKESPKVEENQGRIDSV